MRDEDQELLQRRVGEGIVAPFLNADPNRTDAPDVMRKLCRDAGLSEPNDEWDLDWLPDHPHVAVKGPIERADDDELIRAYRLLYGEDWVETPEPWKPGFFRLFASHITADKQLVSAVGAELDHFGIHMFVAHETINPTDEWQNIIESGLASCHALAAFITPNFHSSLWTDQEVGFVYGRRALVLSLMLGESPYGFLAKTQGLQVHGRTSEEISEKVFETLLKKRALNDVMAEGLFCALEASQSYRSANRRVARLRRVKTFPQKLVAPLQAGHKFNGELEARDVGPGARDLLQRVR